MVGNDDDDELKSVRLAVGVTSLPLPDVCVCGVATEDADDLVFVGEFVKLLRGDELAEFDGEAFDPAEGVVFLSLDSSFSSFFFELKELFRDNFVVCVSTNQIKGTMGVPAGVKIRTLCLNPFIIFLSG